MSIISIFNRNEHTQIADHPARPEAAPVEGGLRGLPPLMLLTSDAAGPSVRTLHSFPDAESAAAFIQFWFPLSERSNIIAFWATNERPATAPVGNTNGEAGSACAMADSAPPVECEAVVMARHPEHEGSVYPFSFTDLETANRFVIEEMKRGLDPRSVVIYWATFCTVEPTPDGEVFITPSTPPALRSGVEEAAAEAGAFPEESIAATGERTAAPVADADPIAAYVPPAKPTTLNEVMRELAETLRATRTMPQRAFQGFGSPPGRF